MSLGLGVRATALGCKECLEDAFTKAAPDQRDWIQMRLMEFNLWTAALNIFSRSENTSVHQLMINENPYDVVLPMLHMLAISLDRYRDLTDDVSEDSTSSRPETAKEADDDLFTRHSVLTEVSQDVELTMERLLDVGVTIRRSWRTSRFLEADATFSQKYYSNLRAHLTPKFADFVIDDGDYPDSAESLAYNSAAWDFAASKRHLIKANLLRFHRLSWLRGHRPSQPAIRIATRFPSSFEYVGQKLTIDDLIDPERISSMKPPSTPSGSVLIRPSELLTGYGAEDLMECPYCLDHLSWTTYSSDEDWKKHLQDDLQPYTCPFVKCPTYQNLYETLDSWKQHLYEFHATAINWVCPACPPARKEIFQSELELRIHLSINHTYLLPRQNFQAAVNRSRRQRIGLEHCPVYRGTSKGIRDEDFMDHIGKCIQDLSIQTLLWDEKDGDWILRPKSIQPSLWKRMTSSPARSLDTSSDELRISPAISEQDDPSLPPPVESWLEVCNHTRSTISSVENFIQLHPEYKMDRATNECKRIITTMNRLLKIETAQLWIWSPDILANLSSRIQSCSRTCNRITQHFKMLSKTEGKKLRSNVRKWLTAPVEQFEITFGRRRNSFKDFPELPSLDYPELEILHLIIDAFMDAHYSLANGFDHMAGTFMQHAISDLEAYNADLRSLHVILSPPRKSGESLFTIYEVEQALEESKQREILLNALRERWDARKSRTAKAQPAAPSDAILKDKDQSKGSKEAQRYDYFKRRSKMIPKISSQPSTFDYELGALKPRPPEVNEPRAKEWRRMNTAFQEEFEPTDIKPSEGQMSLTIPIDEDDHPSSAQERRPTSLRRVHGRDDLRPMSSDESILDS